MFARWIRWQASSYPHYNYSEAMWTALKGTRRQAWRVTNPWKE